MLVYGASNQFFPCAGFAGDEHRGIGWGHFDDAREHALQGWRRSHNLLEHERRIDLLPERKVFVTHPFLGSLAILNIRPSGIPANNVPVVVAKGIEADKKPPIVTVFSKRSLLKFKRLKALPHPGATRKYNWRRRRSSAEALFAPPLFAQTQPAEPLSLRAAG